VLAHVNCYKSAMFATNDNTCTNNEIACLQVKSWLPQQDILAHKNVKVFVTHGGLFSLLEGLYHGTTMVGLPLATDQFANMGRAKVSDVTIKRNCIMGFSHGPNN
jgi:UDP:flavonoid glycosyltransferase YjiC (YdhE family)